jgi:hypothetical protein
MNAPAIDRNVEQLESLAQPPDKRRGHQRSDGGDQEQGEIGFQGRVTSRTKEESLVMCHLTFFIGHLFELRRALLVLTTRFVTVRVVS